MPKWEEMAEAFTIFAKYGDKIKNQSVCAEHDEIYAGHGVDEVVSAEDLARLKVLGWRISDVGGFCKYV